MFEVKVLVPFQDMQNKGKVRKAGEVYTIKSPERFLTLSGRNEKKTKFVELVSASKRGSNKREGKKIMVHQGHLYCIGGIETFLYNLVKRYRDRNITIVCALPDLEQVVRLSEYADILIDKNQLLECDVMILGNYDGDKILHRVKAKSIYQMIHADLEGMKKSMGHGFDWTKNPKVKEVICVSDTAAKGLKKVSGYDAKVIYNILDNDYQEEDGKNFITLSRATKEKGILRMLQMADAFKAANKKFTWFICCSIDQIKDRDVLNKIKSMKEFIIIPPDEDNKKYINCSDYLVQLSDTESFCYSAFEALQRGVPVILTDFPEAKNIVDDGENGYILKMDLSNLDVDKIFNHKPKNIYYIDRCNEDSWEQVFKGEF